MGINGTLCRTPPNAEDFEQGAHIRALLLYAIAQTALTLTVLKSEDLEGTAKEWRKNYFPLEGVIV